MVLAEGSFTLYTDCHRRTLTFFSDKIIRPFDSIFDLKKFSRSFVIFSGVGILDLTTMIFTKPLFVK